MSEINFEEIADEFTEEYTGDKISRADKLVIYENHIELIEDTNYYSKNLETGSKDYTKELKDNIKKMWGSLVILAEKYKGDDVLKKKRHFVIRFPGFADEEKNNKINRDLRNMIDDLREYKDGAYDKITYKKVLK